MSSENTIVECVFDIQFESTSVAESFISTIAQVDGFEQITKLPLHQVSDMIRKNDPNLKMQPLYEIKSLENNDYKILLGDYTIGMAIDSDYTSWTNSLFPQIKKIFTKILESKKITKINRMGLRYVDFLESENIFKTGKINVNINASENNSKKIFLRIEDSIEDIQYNKTVANSIKYPKYEKEGSIIDIVTSFEDYELNVAKNIEKIFTDIEKLHRVNKEKFKEVISDEYIAKYGI